MSETKRSRIIGAKTEKQRHDMRVRLIEKMQSNGKTRADLHDEFTAARRALQVAERALTSRQTRVDGYRSYITTPNGAIPGGSNSDDTW